MRSCFSCNRRHRRSSYEDPRLSENKEQKEKAEEREQGLESSLGEGCTSQPQAQDESQPATEAMCGDPKSPPTATMPFPPSDAPSSKDLPRAVCSFPLPDFLPLPPSHPEVIALVRELEAVREFQTHHRRERKKDLRSCQECLKSVKAVREHLQGVKSRLWRVEMKLGIQVPPQELDLDDEEEELEGRQTPTCLSPVALCLEEEAQENT